LLGCVIHRVCLSHGLILVFFVFITVFKHTEAAMEVGTVKVYFRPINTVSHFCIEQQNARFGLVKGESF